MASETKRHLKRNLVLAAGAAVIVAGLGYLAFDFALTDEQSVASVGPDAGNGERISTDGTADDILALGRTIYASQCAACHGAQLEGQPNWRTRKPNGRLPAPPHDETGHTWHHDDETLFNLTKYGLSALVGQPVETDMPAYDGVLSDEQIRAVLAYIKSRWPAQIRQRQAEMSRRAAAE